MFVLILLKSKQFKSLCNFVLTLHYELQQSCSDSVKALVKVAVCLFILVFRVPCCPTGSAVNAENHFWIL